MSKKPGEKKIMTFGTFDGLHPGHLDFFRQARGLAPRAFLVVSVARDRNVLRIKGRRPVLNEKKRVALLKKPHLLDKVVLGGLADHIAHILKERPDIIALGYDQKDYVKNLRTDLKKKGLRVKVVRLRPYKEKIYKNTLLRPRRASS
jgi:FAD synthetase